MIGRSHTYNTNILDISEGVRNPFSQPPPAKWRMGVVENPEETAFLRLVCLEQEKVTKVVSLNNHVQLCHLSGGTEPELRELRVIPELLGNLYVRYCQSSVSLRAQSKEGEGLKRQPHQRA